MPLTIVISEGAIDASYHEARSHLDEMAHPTRFERVTFAFGGQRWGYFSRLPEKTWNYLVQVIG